MLQPPHIDGVQELTSAQAASVRAALTAIASAFVATDDVPVCDTFYIVAAYNKANVGSEINGDTAQWVLGGAGAI